MGTAGLGLSYLGLPPSSTLQHYSCTWWNCHSTAEWHCLCRDFESSSYQMDCFEVGSHFTHEVTGFWNDPGGSTMFLITSRIVSVMLFLTSPSWSAGGHRASELSLCKTWTLTLSCEAAELTRSRQTRAVETIICMLQKQNRHTCFVH